jgi:hypothetical protein
LVHDEQKNTCDIIVVSSIQKWEKIMNQAFMKVVVERAARTFAQGYLGSWLATGADFDGLVNASNLKVGVVAVALSVAMSMGLKKVGPNKDSASVL